MDRAIQKIISTLKDDMAAHAEDAMSLPTPDLAKYCEIVGAYRGMKHALHVIENALREDDDS